MDKPLIDAMAERLEGLERENRRWRWISALVLIGAIALIAGGADQARIVEAERIVLRDKGGKMRVVLEVKDDGTPRLALLDRDGKPGVELEVDSQIGSSLLLNCEEGASRIWSLANRFGSAHSDFTVSKGKRLSLRSSRGGDNSAEAELSLGGLDGPERVRLMVRDEAAGLDFWSDKGEKESGIGLGTGPDGSTYLSVIDKNEKPRLILGGAPDTSPFLKLLDKNGAILFQAPNP